MEKESWQQIKCEMRFMYVWKTIFYPIQKKKKITLILIEEKKNLPA